MKKFILFYLMTFMVCSCIEYTPIPTNEMVEVSFTHQMVSGKPMVRSGGSVLEDIASSTPTYLDLRLRNIELDTTFTCKSDESIRIPMGEYEIYGENVGRTNDNVLYDVPPIKCDTFITTIDESINSVSLDVYYDCYAVVALTNECKEIHLHTTGDKYITYGVFGGDYITRYFKTDVRLTLIPNEGTDLIPTTYEFSTTSVTNKVNAEYGKYYLVHPQRDNSTNGSFTIVPPNMSEGKI